MKVLMKNQRHHTRVQINSQPFNRYTRKRININNLKEKQKCSLVLALNEIPLMVLVKRIEKIIMFSDNWFLHRPDLLIVQ